MKFKPKPIEKFLCAALIIIQDLKVQGNNFNFSRCPK